MAVKNTKQPAAKLLIRALFRPGLVLQKVLQRLPISTRVKLDLDALERPQYAYGVHRAALQAKALGLTGISVIEFGVGSGRGLLALERLADQVEAITGVQIQTIGFDLGTGLPEPEDYRDLPHLFGGGYYPMDEAKLRSTLRRSKLVIGKVRETANPSHAAWPIGFISFDLDYYSSTRDAFRIFEGALSSYLPRVICYFDDTMNPDAMGVEFTGESLAIREFNDSHPMKIGQILGLKDSRTIPSRWNEQMYACHLFDHPLYAKHITPAAEGFVRSL